jgi:alkylhydroperoxidase/carboxymuconolactone decarboxylase family protein YurZ
VPRIPYPDPSTITDPEILGYLEDARLHGAPRPESQAIRAHVPAVIRAFSQAWQTVFRTGVLDHEIKELCRVYVSQSIECEY